MHRTRAFLLLSVAATLACGSISDPSRTNGSGEVGTVTGKLSGDAAPANARVALVWRTGETVGFSVGADAPVVNGTFSLALTEPDPSYFVAYSATNNSEKPSPSTALGNSGDPSASTSPPSTSPTPLNVGAQSLRPLDAVSGSISSTPLSAAVAGFVVYVDANGNGTLDLTGSDANSVDTIIGGNDSLILVDFRDGNALDYEALRDTTGGKPAPGWNLGWSAHDRWLGLDMVDLSLSATNALPEAVCSGPSNVFVTSGSSVASGTAPCSNDGRSYTPYTCTTTPGSGLCGRETVACAAGATVTIPPGQPFPSDWACGSTGGTTTGGVDGDAGASVSADASTPNSNNPSSPGTPQGPVDAGTH